MVCVLGIVFLSTPNQPVGVDQALLLLNRLLGVNTDHFGDLWLSVTLSELVRKLPMSSRKFTSRRLSVVSFICLLLIDVIMHRLRKTIQIREISLRKYKNDFNRII